MDIKDIKDIKDIRDIRDMYKGLSPLKNRIHFNNAITCFIYALILAGAVSFILSFTALFLPIPFLTGKLAFIYAFFTVAALVVSFFLRPDILKTIVTGDSLGLKERLITAYQLRDEDSPLAKVQRLDAIKSVSEVNFKAIYPIKVPYYKLLSAFVLMGAVFVTMVIPTVARERAQKTENVLGETKKQAEKLDSERKELSKNKDVSSEKLKEMNKKIDELLKEMNKSKNEEEALKAISKAKHEVDKLKDKGMDEELKKLAEKLSNNALTKDFGDALKEGNSEKLEDKLNELKDSLRAAKEKDKEELSEGLADAAGEMGNKELAEKLTELANTLKSDNLGMLENNLQSLSDILSNLQNKGDGTSLTQNNLDNQTLSQMAQALNEAKYQISKQAGNSTALSSSSSQASNSQSSSQGNQGGQGSQGSQGSQGTRSGQGSQGGQGNQGGQSGQSGQNGQGQSGQSGQGGQLGQGNQGGQGGQGSQGGGSGAGSGTTNKDAGYSEGDNGGSGGKKPGEKKVVDYEKIHVPKRLGGDSEASQVSGQKNESGQSQWSEVTNLPVGEGESIPYNEVFEEYRDEAMTGIKEAPIPPGMKDIVRDYFSTLE